MRPKSLILVMVALACGLVAAFAAFQVVGKQGASPEAVETMKVFVAMAEIDIDEEFGATNVQLEEWPKDRVPEGAITDLENLEARYAAQRLYKGEIIIEKKVVDPEDRSSKALLIPEGYRVCAVKVGIDALNGLLNPGDRVDLMVFLRKSRDVTVTGIRSVLRDVRIFAVNAETERAYDKEGNTITAKTVSFLVKPDQAGKLLLASQIGELKLTLRRPGEADSDTDSFDMTLDGILRGAADRAYEGEAPSPPASPAVVVAPVQVAPPEPVEAKAQMLVIYPDGAQRHVWYKDGELPKLVTDDEPGPQEPSGAGELGADPKTGAPADGGLAEFDDDDGFGETDGGDQSNAGEGSEDSF